MKFAMLPVVFALFSLGAAGQSSTQRTSAKTQPRLLISECADDGFYAYVPDSTSRTRIARIGNIDLDAAFVTSDEENGARFWLVRQGKTIFSFTAKHLLAS